jgi:histidine ammonia-lyase
MQKPQETDLIAGDRQWSIEDVLAVCEGRSKIRLAEAPSWRENISRGAEIVERFWREGRVVYGVTTGFGASCDVIVPHELVEELPRQLIRFHGCGLGAALDETAGAAVLCARLISLCRGMSGIRLEVLEAITVLLNRRIIPVIPEEGSVGASGDLTPLSYAAAVLIGDRDVYQSGHRRPASEVFAEENIQALVLRPKEALAIMNGTAMMTGLACQIYARAEYLLRLATRITSMVIDTSGGNKAHFHPRLFEVKPHPGQARVAAWIWHDLADMNGAGSRLQDRYSMRCAPHILGILADALPGIRQTIEIELNSANDNPLIDVDDEAVYHGGHFYGGHIGYAMDCLKIAVAHVADLLDRQLAALFDRPGNNGLPPNLSGALGDRKMINHGLKALQIGVSAWTSEALQHGMPATLFSRSTESHNQDKVSLGTTAARDCLRVIELVEQVAAGCLVAAVQAARLRRRDAGQWGTSTTGKMADALQDIVPFVEDDCELEQPLRSLLEKIRERGLVFEFE